jgi:uncharacterized protein (DUF1778 family)
MSVARAKSVKRAIRGTSGRRAKIAVKKAVRRTAGRRVRGAILLSEIKLSVRDSKRLLKDIATPPAPNEKLKKAAARYKQIAKQNR